MQRVPPVINLEAAQGSPPSWTRPPIYQVWQKKKHWQSVCVLLRSMVGENLYFLWSGPIIQHILFPCNSMRDRPMGTDLMTFCSKNIKFRSTRATITAVFIGRYRFKVNPWLQIRFLSFVHRFNHSWMLSLWPRAILALHLEHEPEQLYLIWITKIIFWLCALGWDCILHLLRLISHFFILILGLCVQIK